MTDKEKGNPKRRQAIRRMLQDIGKKKDLCYIVDITSGCYWTGSSWSYLADFATGYLEDCAAEIIAHRFSRFDPLPVIRHVSMEDHFLITRAHERVLFSLNSPSI